MRRKSNKTINGTIFTDHALSHQDLKNVWWKTVFTVLGGFIYKPKLKFFC